MSNNINNLAKIIIFKENINQIKTNYDFLNYLKNIEEKTELEIKAYKGLRRTLRTSIFVGIIFAFGILLGTFYCAKTADYNPGHHNEYMVETDPVKNGVVRYHYGERSYDVTELGYEEGTWLYIYSDRETDKVVFVEDMFEANEIAAAKESEYITKGLIVYGVSIVFFIIYFIISRIWMKPFSEWKKCVVACASEIMTALENGASMEEVKQMLDKSGHYGMSASTVRNILFAFSSTDPEFWETLEKYLQRINKY